MQEYIQLILNFNQEFYIWLLPELILLFGILSNSILKVIKFLYNISKVSNYQFATYYIYYKDKFEIKKSIYNLYLLYNSDLFSIVEMQMNNILILAYNNFINKEKAAIKSIKIMTKN